MGESYPECGYHVISLSIFPLNWQLLQLHHTPGRHWTALSAWRKWAQTLFKLVNITSLISNNKKLCEMGKTLARSSSLMSRSDPSPGGKCHRGRHDVVALMPQKYGLRLVNGLGGASVESQLGIWVSGGLQRRLQRGAGRWSARITESSVMCHDADALTQEFHRTEILCSPENTKTRTFHSFPFVLTW